MGVLLEKGGNVSLEKVAPGMSKCFVGLGWDARSTDGQDFDLDASCFLIGNNGKVINDSGFIFYNNLLSTCGSVEHQGDNLTGDGDGDDEVVNVDLKSVPPEIAKIVIGVTIHDAEARNQNFGQISNSSMRLVNQDGEVEVVRYDLTEDYSTETALIFGELYRYNSEWKLKAIGQGFSGGLSPMASEYGVKVG